ncbi:hypothetical protein [Parafrankia sp. FMc2]|uniref:hypothetical protein n=1 Tax=Parafrankia sp. FMc2 TaxID=3233196 RepID=UPI0034D6508B
MPRLATTVWLTAVVSLASGVSGGAVWLAERCGWQQRSGLAAAVAVAVAMATAAAELPGPRGRDQTGTVERNLRP